jgi:hypothetical protein
LDWITPRADAFVAALVLRAMSVGEDIEVRAPLSARLARGLEEYQRTLASWFPHRLTPVEIHGAIEPAGSANGGATWSRGAPTPGSTRYSPPRR